MPRRRVATQEPEAELDIEQVGLDVENPTDINEVGDVPKPTTTDKVVEKVRDFFSVDHAYTSSKNPKRKTFRKLCNALAGVLVTGIGKMLPEGFSEPFEVSPGDVRTVAPNKEALLKVLMPLATIADRHINVVADNPDVEDILTSLGAIVIVIYDTQLNYRLYRLLLEQEKARETSQNHHIYPYQTENASPINLDKYIPGGGPQGA